MSRIGSAVAEKGKLLLGVVHLLPLPGSPGHRESLQGIIDAARRDADALLETGFDGFVLENFGDVPFFARTVPPHVVASMTRIACALPARDAFRVVNVLRNDAAAALAVAIAAEYDAFRVNVHTGAVVADQGIIEGRAAETLRYRRELGSDASILADVAVKHAAPIAAGYGLEAEAQDAARRGLADALIVTGEATGRPADLDHVRRVRAAVPERPLLVGSGATAETIAAILAIADGVIVGSALERGGSVDRARAKQFVERARSG